MKRLLIAGGGYADVPLILAAKRLGYRVFTSGDRRGDYGHQFSDNYEPADFSKPEAILEIAKKLRVDAVCSCCNDFSAISTAYTAEKLGLPGHDSLEVALTIHHKDRYRKFAAENGVASPKALGFTDIKAAIQSLSFIRFPIIVKPVDLTGGKGISTLYSMNGASLAIEKAFVASRSKRVVVEEFIEGSRHGYSTILVDGRVVFSFADNEHYYLNQYLVSGASTPSSAAFEVQSILLRETERIAALLSLKSGIFHIQFILSEDGPIIIEICRRAPGDLYVKLVEHSTGVDYAEWIVRAAAGLDCSKLKQAEPKGFFIRHCVMPSKGGVITGVTIDKRLQGYIIDQLMLWRPGDIISDIFTYKAGIVFLQFPTQLEMDEFTPALQHLIKIETK